MRVVLQSMQIWPEGPHVREFIKNSLPVPGTLTDCVHAVPFFGEGKTYRLDEKSMFCSFAMCFYL